MRIGGNGLSIEMHYESLNDDDLTIIGLQPKMDPAGIWTSGYGRAIRYKGAFLRGIENKAIAYQFTVPDEPTARQNLYDDNANFEDQINSLKLNLNQNQFDALVSFIYNLGFTNLLSSTLLKRIKTDMPPELITEAFLMWNKCGGKVLPGLTFRRQTEALLFTTGELKFFN
jgi:lysozyme